MIIQFKKVTLPPIPRTQPPCYPENLLCSSGKSPQHNKNSRAIKQTISPIIEQWQSFDKITKSEASRLRFASLDELETGLVLGTCRVQSKKGLNDQKTDSPIEALARTNFQAIGRMSISSSRTNSVGFQPKNMKPKGDLMRGTMEETKVLNRNIFNWKDIQLKNKVEIQEDGSPNRYKGSPLPIMQKKLYHNTSDTLKVQLNERYKPKYP